jgi:hypothetical protein
MTDTKAAVLDILKADSTLKNMLPNNRSFYRMGKIPGDAKLPAIMMRDGPSVNLDERLFRNELYIRIYDEPEMGTIRITPIGIRIKELLHLQNFQLKQGEFIKCKLNNTLGELEDQAYHKTFVEHQYRISSI